MTKLSVNVSTHDHAQGAATAPITLVEYGDYECSHCGRAYPVVKQLQAKLGTKLRLVFRNFPLTQSHPHALHAAEVAEAGALHGKFWELHDKLYENQGALDDRHLLGYAKELGLDPEKIASDASSDKVVARIRADIESGENSGLTGTPTFYINGIKHEGGSDYASLLAALEAASHHA
ncbi:MAG TPA: thioredoxin domain-containing protein [Kofleriaceae bacterium]|jgi:protein-disulfide isomerase